ncbi:membrane dipeptidase [Actinoplanes bogorensis]|uniref:Membrane dipeptidase n=1 Tax=Paractinoplanes bogorensis TaxID=1610840 RepID=A0ABS5YWW6_9ACTN|nr:membrane dipeptidase [Actinoplanes bogorensis]MBU2667937.1 membrane dipeptidase [Actinoplanes bogorensis]
MTRLRKLAAGLLALGITGGLAVPAAAAPAWTPANDLEGVCATLQVFDGTTSRGYVRRDSVGYGFTGTAAGAEPFRFEASQLGRYLLRDSTGKPPYQSVLGWVWAGDAYGERADWTVSAADGRYRFVSTATGQQMGVYLGGLGAGNSASTIALTPAGGCAAIPDIATGVSGTPAPGVDANGKLVGWIDAHAHITAAEAFGGSLHCGDPYAPGGAPVALKGCPSHATLGWGALLEAIIAGTDPINSAEDGWPTFGDWPQYDTMLHEASYFRSLERAWKSGQRVLNQLLVANRVICGLTLEHTSCDEMDQIRAQATYLRKMQDYVDARSGGPGKGWFRLATTPAQVRQIAAQGKLAVTMGVENSEIFGCREVNDVPQCTKAQIDAGLDELTSLGVSGIYPIHKFDNAFGGTRFDEGVTGAAVNVGNLISTGHWWQATSCTGPSDNEQPIVSDDFAKLLQLGVGLPAGAILPVYPSGKICNVRGLTDLGRYLIQKMMDRGMIIHIDHMSVKAASTVLDMAEQANYPGVASVHSWADPTLINRTLGVGGFVAGYAFSASDDGQGNPTFLQEWRTNNGLANGSKITGYGIGTDVNGLGTQPAPRLNAGSSPLVYPFTATNGTQVSKQVYGTRTFDLNTDGVAQYGLYPDYIVDLINQAGPDGAQLRRQLLNGAEAYTVMWEKARS